MVGVKRDIIPRFNGAANNIKVACSRVAAITRCGDVNVAACGDMAAGGSGVGFKLQSFQLKIL